MLQDGRSGLAALRRLAVVLVLASVPTLAAVAQNSPCQSQSFEGSTFQVCSVDTRRASVALFLADSSGTPLRSFERLATFLGPNKTRVRFAMNAGMFDKAGEPVGLLVENGAQLHAIDLGNGAGNFYMKPNGVFWVDSSGTMHIESSEQFVARRAEPAWATQSGPLLLKSGALHPQISPDGPSTYIRNAVGLRDDRDAVFVISDSPVSFGRLARFFRDALGCKDALYLDGAISGIWIPSTGRQDHDHLLGPMLAVFDKAN